MSIKKYWKIYKLYNKIQEAIKDRNKLKKADYWISLVTLIVGVSSALGFIGDKLSKEIIDFINQLKVSGVVYGSPVEVLGNFVWCSDCFSSLIKPWV